jgi:transcription antitermination factor NusG
MSSTIQQDNQWYAIYTRSRFEKKMYQGLLKSGHTSFLPLVKEKRPWSDRLKTMQVPLLPSYVFVWITKADFPQVYNLPGFVRFVSFEGKPCVIRETEIDLLKKIVTHGLQAEQAVNIEVGEKVRITRGYLKDWEGRIERKMGQSRVVFQFESFQQAIVVEVGIGDIEKIEN